MKKKLIKTYLSDIKNGATRKSIADEIGGAFAIFISKAMEKYGKQNVNAEVVIPQEDLDSPCPILYDLRIFDPYRKACGNLYLNADGWSGWLDDYHDTEGNDINAIFDKYGGVPQNE